MINRLSFGAKLDTEGFNAVNFKDRYNNTADASELEHINSYMFGSEGQNNANSIGTEEDLITLKAVGNKANTAQVLLNGEVIGTVGSEQIAKEHPESPVYVARFLCNKAFALVKEALK
jgi:hypothetical protein